MMLVSRRRTIPGTVEGTEIPCEHFVCERGLVVRWVAWECRCVPLTCGYVLVCIDPC